LHALNAEGTESEGRRNAILKEARRASQVSDRRIAAIYDVLELENDVLLVMEYVDGTTLRARMSQPLPIDEFWDLATQCVEAVGAAHAHGVIHRDIKPENLMLTPRRRDQDPRLRHRAPRREPGRNARGQRDHGHANHGGARPRHRRHAAVHGARGALRRPHRRAHRHLLARDRVLRAARAAKPRSPGRPTRLCSSAS
jgi:serine/threonine protein kinase